MRLENFYKCLNLFCLLIMTSWSAIYPPILSKLNVLAIYSENVHSIASFIS